VPVSELLVRYSSIVRRFIDRAWRFAAAISTLAFWFSLGVASFVSALLTNAVAIRTPWQTVFFFGVLLSVAAVVFPIGTWAYALIRVRISASMKELRPVDDRNAPLRAACRQILAEVRQNHRRLTTALTLNSYWSLGEESGLLLGHWGEDDYLLAGAPGADSTYSALASAYDAFSRINSEVEQQYHLASYGREDRFDVPDMSFGDGDSDRVRDAIKCSVAAEDALASFLRSLSA